MPQETTRQWWECSGEITWNLPHGLPNCSSLIQIDAKCQLFQRRGYRWNLCGTQHWNSPGISPSLLQKGKWEKAEPFAFLWCLTEVQLGLKSVLQKSISVCEADPHQDITNIFDYSISTQKQMSERSLYGLIKIILWGCMYLMKYEA